MMEKVVVPKYVAEFIEVKREENDLERIVRDYNFFSNALGSLTSEHLNAIEWYVENPYEFIRAWVEGYEVEEEKMYYWRKKREHRASFEGKQYLRITDLSTSVVTLKEHTKKYSELEARNWLGVTDFELFEKGKEEE